MTTVEFEVRRQFAVSIERLWQSLIDWPSHGDWIPATQVRVLFDNGGVGTRFVARTGLGPLGFDDHMTVVELDPVDFSAVVRKTGPLLLGSADFKLSTSELGAVLRWHESIEVPWLPPFLAPLLARIGTTMFRYSMGRLARHLARS